MDLIVRQKPEISLEQGLEHFKKGELNKALAVLDALIAQNPYRAHAYWARAICRERLAKDIAAVNGAISDYSKSIVYASEAPAISYGRRGILYFKSGRYEEALKDLEKALEVDRCWIEALFYRGRTLVALSRGAEDAKRAEKDFGEVIRTFEAPFAPAHFWRAQARRLAGDDAGAVEDYAEALKIDAKDVMALNALAFCMEHGVGAGADRKKAEALYIKASELGYAAAQKNLSIFYEKEDGANAERAAHWMRKAARSGDAEAQYLYAQKRLNGEGVAKDAQRAAHYFRLAAKQGYAPAICGLADCCERGLGLPREPARAFAYYKLAARKGSRQGAYNVGRHYYYGIGSREDNGKAFGILKPLADEGMARAQDIVGMCFQKGYGVKSDAKRAAKYYRLAHEQGHPHAAAHLAALYRDGNGVKKNMATAAKLYAESGGRGSPLAWYSLGRLYYDDKRDFKKAAEAFAEAAKLGESGVLSWQAKALMRVKNPNPHAEEIVGLWRRCMEEEEKLYGALMLCRFDCCGVCGWPINPKGAVAKLKSSLQEAGGEENSAWRGAAYAFLGRAHELGLGVVRDAQKAAGYYRKAAETGDESGFAAACLAHMHYNGIGCGVNRKEGENALEAAVKENMAAICGVTGVLYIWSWLSSGAAVNTGLLASIAARILRNDPNDCMAAYMLWYLNRGASDEKKHMQNLRGTLKAASPYHRHMVESRLRTAPGDLLYPLITADVVDACRV